MLGASLVAAGCGPSSTTAAAAPETTAAAAPVIDVSVVTSAELNDVQVRLLQTEWNLMQAKYARITAAARARVAAGVS